MIATYILLLVLLGLPIAIFMAAVVTVWLERHPPYWWCWLSADVASDLGEKKTYEPDPKIKNPKKPKKGGKKWPKKK